MAVKKLIEAMTSDMCSIDGLEVQYRKMVESAMRQSVGGVAERLAKLHRERSTLTLEQGNMAASMAEYGPMPFIKQKVAALAVREVALAGEQQVLDTLSARQLVLPPSTESLRQ